METSANTLNEIDPSDMMDTSTDDQDTSEKCLQFCKTCNKETKLVSCDFCKTQICEEHILYEEQDAYCIICYASIFWKVLSLFF